MSDDIGRQSREFDAVDALAVQALQLHRTPIVDDDYPRMRHRYELAILHLIAMMHDNRRTFPGQPAHHWFPIADAPHDGSPILACAIDRPYVPITAYWASFHPNAEGKTGWRDAPIGGRKLELTHFMPLPKPHQDQHL